jgi:hypothetical protein
MRSQRKAVPLLALLGFEVAAIVGLQTLGSSHTMQIPWSDLSTWMDTSTTDQLALPVLRIAALILAYWLFVSTALSVIAQVSRIPSAIRATSMFTLPSVRRVVDSAMVMSIATTSVIGITGTAAFADTSTPPPSDLTTSIAASPDDLSVPTPGVGADVTTSTDPGAVTTTAPTTSTTLDPSTSTTGSPDNTTIAPTAGDDWVPTPSPGAAIATTTTVPQGPSTPANPAPNGGGPSVATPAPGSSTGTQVLAEQDHRVVAGENLWTISRDAIAANRNVPASQISESDIRDYWLTVIATNRDNLRSHDPHWIFPGEVISLPSMNPSGASS